MEKAFQPVQIGKSTIPNRFIMGSMHLGLEGKIGTAERMAAFYGKRFEGGVGLIVTGGIGVNEEGRGSKHFFNIQTAEHANELKKMNSLLKGKGIMCAQLFHAGRYAFDRNCVAPSAIRAPINRYVPRALTEEECWKTVEDFGKAAKLSLEAGFGAVEIMGSEGYLINQFFSAVTNQRDDHFGGDLERRMNMAVEVLRSVIKNLPEGFPVIFRMSGIDLIPGNPTFEDVCLLANTLKKENVSALNIGIGWHESRVPTISQLVPRGAWANIAGRIKEKTPGVPIIASNRVNDPVTAQTIFEKGQADIISMARPFLADSDIVNKIQTGMSSRINTCIACNQSCLDHAFIDKSVSCLVNPRAVNELEYEIHSPVKSQKVVVIGSGPGGLEAARASASLGHKVILMEKSDQLGGQFNLASNIPGKSEFKETIRYFKNELTALGVEIRLNTNCDLKLLNEIDADTIIFATGVKPREFDLPGIELLPHGNYTDYLTGKFLPGKKVAVIGGGGIGVDVAHKLTEDHDPTLESYSKKYNINSYTNAVIQPHRSKREVAIFRRNGKHGAGLGPTTFWALKQELEASGVEFFQGLNYKEITKDGIKVVLKNGEEVLYPCDSLILCVGQEKETALYETYRSLHPQKQIFLIGGAKDAKGIDAERAFLEGLNAAFAIGKENRVSQSA
ncbi:FAD-dependent oxidoreductase [Leptospira stimsonii]|uniref:FAD-dependent oxidoreductase n=1 Tax=Leptospira stimsonii TaxID=2202203 RepID=A0A4R9L1A2_9LEPT|nr:NADPH-dependent 2,4-dienoyl-CoA reductase [Leptospira stimsonii]RHX88816.1 NADPH-dependent 2,4-dienoyl-CoA reductase [Leptospira stimsonii]TGK17758.1 FAD-dependent oxidoreductase [Leptospira stimsonii]TGM12601.1 FAD-dependent oxidoreductase [Leptospira stimsonii]